MLVVGLLAWTWGLVFQGVHAVTTVHVRCEQHHEIVEFRVTGGVAADAEGHHHPEIKADHHRPHPEHYCVLQGIQLLGTPTIAVLAPSRFLQYVPLRQVRPRTSDAPRGPPLEYAPKTSPPVATA